MKERVITILADTLGIPAPQIHVVVGNRLTQYQGAAAAFDALSNATADALFTAFQKHPQYFTGRPAAPQTIADFRCEYSVPLRDFNTAGVVAAHMGQRLSKLSGGYYTIHGQQVQINSARVDDCIKALDALVAMMN